MNKDAQLIVCIAVCLSLLGCSDMPQTSEQVANLDRASEIRTAFVGSAGESGTTQSDVEPVGWATLRGRFQLTGSAPSIAPLAIDKDGEVCAPGGASVADPAFRLGADNGIQDVVVYLVSKIADTEPWTHPDAAPGKTDPVDFDQKACIFLRPMVAMQSSQPLRILNSDPVGHNTNMTPKASAAFNQSIPIGTSGIVYQATGQEKEPVAVACSIHRWMGAHILFRKNSYFAVTGEDGSFEIPNLPAGVDLEFRVWHAKSKFVQNVVVDGTTEKWGKGRFTKNLTADAELVLDVKVDGSEFN